MAGENEIVSKHGIDTEAAAESLALAGASRDKADAYLDEQIELSRLQRDNLLEQNAFELSHLKFRRFSDYAKFALEVSVGLVVLLVVCGLVTMVWSATRDHDLVVDAFQVPQDVAETGLTGTVLAGRVLDSFGHMQDETIGTTQGAGSYHANLPDTVRVEIPSTGISIGELNRYLRLWLGDETHVTGDLVHTASGYALTTRFGAQPGVTVRDKADNLDALVRKSAEQVFAAALPYRYVEYLVKERRFAEASALVPQVAVQGTAKERALANSAWAKVYFYEGDMRRALEKGRDAVALDPDNPISHSWLSVGEANFGHNEAARENIDAALREWKSGGMVFSSARMAMTPFIFTAYRDELVGDFAGARVAWTEFFSRDRGENGNRQNFASDAAAAHDFPAAYRVVSTMTEKDPLGRPDDQIPWARLNIACLAGDWTEAVKQAGLADAILRTQPDTKWNELLMRPEWAYALARTGDFRGADAVIAETTQDCDDCLLQQGRIAALEGRPGEAVQDFDMVAARSPHEPFAETYWGQMLMAKGDLDGAIAKFEIAHRKGPHFADPLEMWGEALIAENRSDLALAKFDEANKYAPNWGRLHLKWGDALWWSGNRDEAKKQFSLAAMRDLTAPERAELARVH
ncbi:MAG TPA: hypothetical protein VMF58_10500 [Rhizomicrobium sp.]|nr:hypothetical protein [Rhizomicrobium sp.]